MAKILEFANYRRSPRYRDAVRDLDGLLERFTGELAGAALNLAASGVWREWDAAQPAGSVLELDPHDLSSTEDPLVGRIMELCDRVDELRAEAARRGDEG